MDTTIFFIWSDPLPIYSGRGGSEGYTIGHVRELRERGIDAQIITIGLGKQDGRQFFPDIPFQAFKWSKPLGKLDGTIVFVKRTYDVHTKSPSFVILHDPPPAAVDRDTIKKMAMRKAVMVNSQFAQRSWAEYLGVPVSTLHIVYPFADDHFAKVKRLPNFSKTTSVLFAGRLCPEKGIYTLLEALHHKILAKGYQFNVTTAGNETENGRALEKLLRCHASVKVLPACHTLDDMARLYAKNQILVVPSNHQFWHETFGMVSIEAQHAGCHVVASNDGGLPETDCGGLILFEPGNSYALAQAIQKAAQAGALSARQRARSIKLFTRADSVDLLLRVIAEPKI